MAAFVNEFIYILLLLYRVFGSDGHYIWEEWVESCVVEMVCKYGAGARTRKQLIGRVPIR